MVKRLARRNVAFDVHEARGEEEQEQEEAWEGRERDERGRVAGAYAAHAAHAAQGRTRRYVPHAPPFWLLPTTTVLTGTYRTPMVHEHLTALYP